MSTRFHMGLAVLLCMAVTLTNTIQASSLQAKPSPENDPGLAAYESAADSGKFLMVLFRKTNETSPLTVSFDTIRQSMADTLVSVVIDTENPEQATLVDRYNVRWAPLPMVVIIAPNGAITGNFRTPFTQAQVKATFMSPVSLQCLKAFQQRKLVFICVQGKNTSDNADALAGVTQFKNDPKLGILADVVMIDPGDPAETDLLSQLRVTSELTVAQTLLLGPPGQVLGKWTGATSKDEFTQVLVALARSQKTCTVPGCEDPSCPPPEATSAQGGVN